MPATDPVMDKPKPTQRHLTPVHLHHTPTPPVLGALPLLQGTLGAVEGQAGAWGSVVLGTTLRAGLIAPAIYYFGGVKDWKKLAIASAGASATITVALLAAHALLRRV